MQSFSKLFTELTGSSPFPWQNALYDRFKNFDLPTSINLPTGLGKTSIITIWLIALAQNTTNIPRRLIYVVNRRTVVDQTTTEVDKLCEKLIDNPALTEIRHKLTMLSALSTPNNFPLAISTLRGQFADNGEWCVDPSRPAVVVGTVDMIGSALLFSRYTRGFKTRPLHAGFLAQDALLVHDEAHLEPSFQKLLKSIVTTQNNNNDLHKLHVIELTATSRSRNEKVFGLDENPNDKDTENEIVKKRVNAIKRLSLVSVTKIDGNKDKANDSTVRDKIIDLALKKNDSQRAVLIFVRSVETAEYIIKELQKKKQEVTLLTGTMRGKERDELVSSNSKFQRFLPKKNPSTNISPITGTVFLVATSAGEVGVNLSADDLICDLSTYESMAQRFGRVNRFGEHKGNNASEVTVVYRENIQANYDEGLFKIRESKKNAKDIEKETAAYEKKNQLSLRLIKTLVLLQKLNGDASPSALAKLDENECDAAFSVEPEQRVASEIQFDAWALTSIRKSITARPPVAPYLHGEAEWQPPETRVAWREEPDIITGELRDVYHPEDLLEDFPLKPHELLRDTSERIVDRLITILRKLKEHNIVLPPPAWLVRENGKVELFPLRNLVLDKYEKDLDKNGEDEDSTDADTLNDLEKAKNERIKKINKTRRERAITHLANTILILPKSLGGIDKEGLFTPDAVNISKNKTAVTADAVEGILDQHPYDKIDVADIITAPNTPNQRKRIYNSTSEPPIGFRVVRVIDTLLGKENSDDSDDENFASRYWLWLQADYSHNAKRLSGTGTSESLDAHTKAVRANAKAIAAKFFQDISASTPNAPDLHQCLAIAADLHDLGKNRTSWQRNLGNLDYDPSKPETILAKASRRMRPRNIIEHYRHEFGTLHDIIRCPEIFSELNTLSELERDIVLHLVATHHGRARPHFPFTELFDYSTDATTVDTIATLATEIPRRFARLQQQFGRWGLAWLESLLRAADYAASAGITPLPINNDTSSKKHIQLPITRQRNASTSVITLRLTPENPAHYFACCGLFEFAALLAPDAQACFAENGTFFHITNTPFSLTHLLTQITQAKITQLDSEDKPLTPLRINLANTDHTIHSLFLDWWRYEGSAIGKLKTWAGQMNVYNIAKDMLKTTASIINNNDFNLTNILFSTSTSHSSEPFYFDSIRSVNAHAQDVGMSMDKLNKGGIKIKTQAAPATEFLCLVGLQRARPLLIHERDKEREYKYHLWSEPIAISLLIAAVAGLLPETSQAFQFTNPSRTKDYRAFTPAKPVP